MLSLLVSADAVPPILYRVVWAAQDDLRDLCPSILLFLLQNAQCPRFFTRPVTFLKQWAELVVPALATLLARAARHTGCDSLPVSGTNIDDQLH